MSWFWKIRERREADQKAMKHSQALLEEMVTTEPEAAQSHEDAIRQLNKATEQAKRLRAMNKQNHYSESLTQAFRGNPA